MHRRQRVNCVSDTNFTNRSDAYISFRPTLPPSRVFIQVPIPIQDHPETRKSTIHINGTARAPAARWPIKSGLCASTGTAIKQTATENHMKVLALRTRKNSYGGCDSRSPKILPTRHMAQ